MAIEVTELDWGLMVTGDYGEMKNILQDLRDLRFKWNTGERAWVKQIKSEALRRQTAEAIRDLAKALM